MKSIRRKAATAGALAVLALGGTLAATAPASAATAGAYNGACGAGYEVFTSTPVMSSQRTVAATTYVAYSSADRQWCAVTVRSKPGARVFMEVTLDTWPTSTTPARDAGSYTAFAGPVYKDLPEPGQCMTWSGSIDLYYNSDRGLCP
ncbi:hypothetical protein OHA09_35575 [Streptomyces longwoodensis]|uniref:hypothetical protein n=1 Tax=Streptomyces longwoodensis TaxID=68231 RepID=UPI002E82422D|nr:hypothetical protein [Streptomyces longwoodensis]WUC55835.1 hypothetical protein OHA09_01400 [Streptomyces longwoodensis]WUC62046.1 hypothetical protein OHA09_35575 [Streptomyces longwoodensis]